MVPALAGRGTWSSLAPQPGQLMSASRVPRVNGTLTACWQALQTTPGITGRPPRARR